MLRTPLGRALSLTILHLGLASSVEAIVVNPGFVVESVAPGASFDTPVGIAFLPDGRLLVAEKRGRVYAVNDGVKHPTPMWSSENEVLNLNDKGLLDVAADPNYAANRYVYLLYTVDPDSNGVDDNSAAFGRLTRYQVSHADSNVVDPASRTILMGASWSEGPGIGSPSHTIGSLRWGEDGSLLVSTGDGAKFGEIDAGGRTPSLFGPGRTDPIEDIGAFRSQYLGSLAGKILRLDPSNGHGYPSNPYYDGDARSPRSRVWAYGLRNPFRFAVRPGTGSADPSLGDPGVLYVGDVGWFTWEETNVVTQPGQNFGWPCYEGVGPHDGYQSSAPAHSGCGSIGSPGNPASHRPPIATSHHGLDHLSIPAGYVGGCSIGGVFYTGTFYPGGYQGRYFFADFVKGWIKVLSTDENDNLVGLQGFAEEADGPVDLVTDPVSGDIFYVSIYQNEVRRFRFVGGGANNPPVAVASGAPAAGVAPLTVNFSSAGSYDPDGDPFTASWLFGDLTGSGEPHPSHTYASPGVYRVVLTLDDGRGGIGRDSLQIVVSDQSSGFPTSGILDDFNRPDGPIGGSWVGDVAGLRIDGNALIQTSADSWTIWDGAVFGPIQEAYVTLVQTTPTAPEHDLILKAQGRAWFDGHLEVRYDAVQAWIAVSTYTPGSGWRTYGTLPATLQAGDQLGARAHADGSVEVYVNGVLLGTVSVAGWPYADRGGRLGMTLVGASSSRIDDFGGGDMVVAPNRPPLATVLSPTDGAFYAEGDSVRLSGHGTDAEDPPDSLRHRWEVDLHHNVHVHPNSFVFDGSEGVYVMENHDDGTGVWYRLRFQAIDTDGLRDTAWVDIFPEIDLEATPVTVLPDSPNTAIPIECRFTIRNLGRMPAPYSRWILIAGPTQLASGDTVVAGEDSVAIRAVVPPMLASGDHDLRVVVDTLGAVPETDESNNARTRSLTVTEAPPLAVDGSLPSSVALSNAYPNPSPGPVGFALDLPGPASVEFAVYDLHGREVWRAPAHAHAAGRWTLEWAGNTSHGRPARPGLYLARVTVNGRALTRRLALLR